MGKIITMIDHDDGVMATVDLDKKTATLQAVTMERGEVRLQGDSLFLREQAVPIGVQTVLAKDNPQAEKLVALAKNLLNNPSESLEDADLGPRNVIYQVEEKPEKSGAKVGLLGGILPVLTLRIGSSGQQPPDEPQVTEGDLGSFKPLIASQPSGQSREK